MDSRSILKMFRLLKYLTMALVVLAGVNTDTVRYWGQTIAVIITQSDRNAYL